MRCFWTLCGAVCVFGDVYLCVQGEKFHVKRNFTCGMWCGEVFLGVVWCILCVWELFVGFMCVIWPRCGRFLRCVVISIVVSSYVVS